MYNPDVCIYHSPCADGYGAAWSVWSKYGTSTIAYVPGVHGKPPQSFIDKHVLMVDFSYKKPVLEEMAKTAKSIVIIDHHKSAQEDLADFVIEDSVGINFTNFETRTANHKGNIFAVFDMTHSGAALTWDFFHPNVTMPKLIQHVEDRDLWKWALPGTREINDVVFSYPYAFDVWDRLISQCENQDGFEQMLIEGAAISRKHFKDINELLPLTTRTMIIGGVEVPVANFPYTMASDAAHMLAIDHPFGATYYDSADGKRRFSLRSTDAGMDVSKVAVEYGGGGHRAAAGFEKPVGWEGDTLENKLSND